MRKDITEIVAELVAKMTFPFKGILSTPDGNNFILTSCNTYWLVACGNRIYDIGGNNYTISDVQINESITVNPVGHAIDPGVNATFIIPAPTFRHGTARAINTELGKMKDKVPFVWLFEVIKEKFIGDKAITVERESPIRLFIFDNAKSDWYTEKHYVNVLRPLSQFFDELTKEIDKDSGTFDGLDDFFVIKLPDWGMFNDVKGFTKKIFDEQWSGIELDTTLKIMKNNDCNSCN